MRHLTSRQFLNSGGLALLIAATLGLYTNCGSFGGVNQAASVGDLSIAEPVNPSLAAGKALYTANCVACHGALEQSTKLGKSLADIESAIANQPLMTHLSFLTGDDLAAIAIALNSPLSLTTSSQDATSIPVVSNRYLLSSRLSAFFVAGDNLNNDDYKIQTIITTLVLNHPEAYGGNCSRNDPGCVPKPCGIAGSNCLGQLGTSQTADPSPTVSAVRKGYTIQACEQILSVDKSVRNLLTKAVIDAAQVPDSGSITTLILFVFGGRPPSVEVANALLSVATASKNAGMTSLDQWRFVILPICESDGNDLL